MVSLPSTKEKNPYDLFLCVTRWHRAKKRKQEEVDDKGAAEGEREKRERRENRSPVMNYRAEILQFCGTYSTSVQARWVVTG